MKMKFFYNGIFLGVVGAYFCFFSIVQANEKVQCEGDYPRHVQGVTRDDAGQFYWSWTDCIVKTDAQGKLIKSVPADNHQGDLCVHDGKVYVAVNLGKFNRPAGEAQSWVYVFDAQSLEQLSRHAVNEVEHGAGGIAHKDGSFFVVGGLPPETKENYVYEYDAQWQFKKRHVIASGYTLMGIQTVEWTGSHWYFGCYGKPAETLITDENFQMVARQSLNTAVGIIYKAPKQFWLATNQAKGGRHSAWLNLYDQKDDLTLEVQRSVKSAD